MATAAIEADESAGGNDADERACRVFDRLCDMSDAEFAAYLKKIYPPPSPPSAKKRNAFDAMASVCRAGPERWTTVTVASAFRLLRRYVAFDGDAKRVIGDLGIFLPAASAADPEANAVLLAELVRNFVAETIAKFPHSRALEDMIALAFRGWLTPELAVDVSAWIALGSPDIATAKLLLSDVIDRSVFRMQNAKPRPTKWTALRGDASPLGRYLAALNAKVRETNQAFFLTMPRCARCSRRTPCRKDSSPISSRTCSRVACRSLRIASRTSLKPSERTLWYTRTGAGRI